MALEGTERLTNEQRQDLADTWANTARRHVARKNLKYAAQSMRLLNIFRRAWTDEDDALQGS